MFENFKSNVMKKVAGATGVISKSAEYYQHKSEHKKLYKEWKKNKESDQFKITLDNGDVIYKTVDKKYQPTPEEAEAKKKLWTTVGITVGTAGAVTAGVVTYKKVKGGKADDEIKEVDGEDYTIDLDENGNELITHEELNNLGFELKPEESTDSNSAEA